MQSDLDKKLVKLATKAELNAEQDKIVKLQAFDSSYFRGKSHFEDDKTQNYLVFPLVHRCFKTLLIAITIKITNNMCPRNSIFNFFNHKNFFRPIWSVIFLQ